MMLCINNVWNEHLEWMNVQLAAYKSDLKKKKMGYKCLLFQSNLSSVTPVQNKWETTSVAPTKNIIAAVNMSFY